MIKYILDVAVKKKMEPFTFMQSNNDAIYISDYLLPKKIDLSSVDLNTLIINFNKNKNGIDITSPHLFVQFYFDPIQYDSVFVAMIAGRILPDTTDFGNYCEYSARYTIVFTRKSNKWIAGELHFTKIEY